MPWYNVSCRWTISHGLRFQVAKLQNFPQTNKRICPKEKNFHTIQQIKTHLTPNKAGLLRNKAGLLHNKAGLLPKEDPIRQRSGTGS